MAKQRHDHDPPKADDEAAGHAKADHPAATRKATVSLGAFPPEVVEVPAGTADAEAFARKAYLEKLGVWGPAEQPAVTFEE